MFGIFVFVGILFCVFVISLGSCVSCVFLGRRRVGSVSCDLILDGVGKVG